MNDCVMCGGEADEGIGDDDNPLCETCGDLISAAAADLDRPFDSLLED